MARYEGMEELLQRVRERLGVEEIEREGPSKVITPQSEQPNVPYAELLEAVLLVLRDAEQMSDLAVSTRVAAMTDEQRGDVLDILGKTLRELWRSKAALERGLPGR